MVIARAPVGPVLSGDTIGSDVAVALIILGLEPEAVIAHWRAAPDPAGAVHLAQARSKLAFDPYADHPVFRSVWFENLNDPTPALTLGAWLASSEADARLENAFFALEAEDPHSRAMRSILSRSLG